MWSYGFKWKGPFTFAAGETKTLKAAMNLPAPLKNEWSVVTWGSQTQVDISHSDNIASDAGWPVQYPSGTCITVTQASCDAMGSGYTFTQETCECNCTLTEATCNAMDTTET